MKDEVLQIKFSKNNFNSLYCAHQEDYLYTCFRVQKVTRANSLVVSAEIVAAAVAVGCAVSSINR